MAKKLTPSKAKEILHDKSVHGQPLTDKQRKFFGAIAGGAKPYKAETGGWLDKYGAPQAQNGIEGTMGGLTDKGFNYSPAWGGAWRDGGVLQPPMAGANQTLPMYAMGGNIPGAVGFTYARTQGAAPSEGPYAKKTMPSAQNGQEMRFYQEGLDWTPKNISEYGSEIHKAQVGDDIPWYMRKSSDISQRGNQNLKTEIPSQKTKEKKAIASRRITTIGPDTRTAKQKEKDRQAYEDRVKYEEEVLGRDFTMPTSLQERNRAEAEQIINNIIVPLEAASYVTGVGSIGSNFLRLGASTLEKQIGKNLVSKGLKNTTSRINPIIDKADEALAYAQLDPIGIMGNKLNATVFNPTTAINRTNNTLTGVNRNLKNSAVETADVVAGVNNTENIAKDLVSSNNKKIESGLDWMKQWYSHPDFNRRFGYELSGDYDVFGDNMQESILKRLNRYEPKNYIDLLKDKGIKEYLTYSPTTGGVSYGSPDEIYVNRTMYFPFNKKGLESVRAHELTHLIENNGYMLRFSDQQRLLKPFGISNIDEIPKNPGFFQREILNNKPEYYLDPTEIHARMNQGRFDLGLSPKDEFTEEMFDKVSKNKNWYGMGKYIKDKKEFIDLMNKFWAVPPAVIGGIEVTEKKKEGGVVKDDNGYWNPENWGKPVEIDSNEITMQGVYEPLIGISNTGDMQYMEPGEDYVFDGESVTEYPVAKNGVNQQDEKTVQHLDQLLNFTNYNKPKAKNGWLDKYN